MSADIPTVNTVRGRRPEAPAASSPSWGGATEGGAPVLIAAGLVFAFLARPLVALGLATGAAVLAVLALRPFRSPRRDAAVIILGVGAGLCVIPHVLMAVALVRAGQLDFTAPLAFAAAALLASYAAPVPARLRSTRFALLLVASGALLVAVLAASPAPTIDVWVWQQHAAEGLLDGVNPYSRTYPNAGGVGTPLYAPRFLVDGGARVAAFPYPPLVPLLGAPSFALAGDVRWTLLVCTLLGAVAISWLGRGTTTAHLAAALFLLQPATFLVTEQGWTEPIVLVSTLAVAAALGWARGATGVGAWLVPGAAAALALGSKQYAPLVVLPLVVAAPAHRARIACVGAVGALAIAFPMLVSDPQGFWRGVVSFQLHQPYRPDSLSWLPVLERMTGGVPSIVPAFVIALGVLAVGVRGGASVSRALTTGAAAWLVFVLFNKQAFTNYYWLAGGLLCAAAAAASGERAAAAASGDVGAVAPARPASGRRRTTRAL